MSLEMLLDQVVENLFISTTWIIPIFSFANKVVVIISGLIEWLTEWEYKMVNEI